MMTNHPEIRAQSWCGAFALWMVCFVLALSVLGLVQTNEASADRGDSWARIFVKKGKIQDHEWAVGARLPKHKPLGRICETSVSLLPRPEFDEVEVNESSLCGSLNKPSDSISISSIFKSDEADSTLLATLYRPIVRKVVFVLSNGERKGYPSQAPRIPNHTARGIPTFRYVVGIFGQEECLRKTITYDAQNEVIEQEKSEASCPSEA